MKVAMTGATGFIGAHLQRELQAAGHELTLVTRKQWDVMRGLPPAEAFDGADAVVHLAGEPVSQRWSSEVKRRIRVSRVQGTSKVVDLLETLQRKPQVLVCASAIGYYGDRRDELLTESSGPGHGFLSDVCTQWELEAARAMKSGIRVVMLRSGLVLGRGGGALSTMLTPFRLGAGATLGSGQQWMSWIHIDDMAGLVRFAIENASIQGPLNCVAPNPVRNRDFTEFLASALHRPALLVTPAFVVKTLFGDMSEIMLSSQRVAASAALAAGYQFHFPHLDDALRDILQ